MIDYPIFDKCIIKMLYILLRILLIPKLLLKMYTENFSCQSFKWKLLSYISISADKIVR